MAWTTPATYSSGQVLTAANLNTHIRDNFNTLAPAVCTAIGDTCYATGNKALTRLAIGSPYQVYTMNSGQTAPSWGEGYVPLDIVTQDVEVVSNAAETAIYTSPNIGDNLFGTTSGIVMEFCLSYLNNTGLSQTLAIRFKLDSTTIFTPINILQTTLATRRGTFFRYAMIQNQLSNSQKHFISWQSTTAAGAISGLGVAQSSLMNFATSAIDLSSGIHNIVMTADHGETNTLLSCIIRLSGMWLARAV